MAKRRVDTKFVLILASVLALIVLLIGGYFGYNYYRSRDPEWLQARAREAEAKGDLDTAIRYYSQAIGRVENGKEVLYDKVAQMLYDTSDKDPDRYRSAVGTWMQAVTANRNYKPARERLLKEIYLSTSLVAADERVRTWTELENQATRMIEIDPNHGMAHFYLATAILNQPTGLTDLREAKARSEMELAVKLLPDNPDPLHGVAYLDLRRSLVLAQQNKPDEAAKLQTQTLALFRAFCDKHPKDDSAWMQLSDMYLSLKQPQESEKVLEAARQANPTNALLSQSLARLYLGRNDLVKAEEASLKAVSLDPKNTATHFEMARVYVASRKLPEAIAELKVVMDLHGAGVGIEGQKNRILESQALYLLCGLYMDQAQAQGPTTAEGKASLRLANDYVDEVQGRRANDPELMMLQGRLLLLRGKWAEATALLVKADQRFLGHPEFIQWRQTKELLAEAYERQGENGLALDYTNQVLAKFPGAINDALHRAALLLKMTRATESRDTCLAILKMDPNNLNAMKIIASAYYALGDQKSYDEIIKKLPTNDEAVGRARVALLQGEPRDALELIKPALETDPENIAAIGIVVTADLQLAEKAEKPEDAVALRADARKYVEKALQKNPQNQQFRIMQLTLDNPGAKPDDLKLKIIEGVTDPYEKAVAYSYYYLSKGDVDQQIKYLKDAEKVVDPTTPQASEIVDRIFTAAMGGGKWDMAALYAQRAEQLNLDGVKGVFYKGRLELAQGHTDAALKILKEATALRPDFSMGWTVLGQAYATAGQFDPAVDAFTRAATQSPDNLVALRSLVKLHMMRGDDANRKLAQDWLQKALKFAPRDPELRSYDDLIGDPRAVIARRTNLMKAAQDKGQEDWDNRKRLAIAYIRAQEPERAIEILEPVQKNFPDDLSLADLLARLYRDTGKPDAAFKMYEPFMASKEAQVQFSAMLMTAEMYRSQGHIQEAIQTMQTAVEKAPAGNTEAMRRLADLYFEVEDMPHAEALYRKVEDTDKGKDSNVTLRLAESLIRQDKFPEADLLIARVLQKTPDLGQGQVLKGYSLLRQKKGDEAIKTFNAVLDKDPNNLDALHYRAFAQFYMQGDLKQAIADLQRVRTMRQDAIQSRLLLARVYRLNRQYDEAVHEYQEVLKIQPAYTTARLEYTDFLFSLANAAQHMESSTDAYAVTLRRIQPVETLTALLADSAKQFPTQPAWIILQGDLQVLLGNQSLALAFHRQAAEVASGNPEAMKAYLGTLLLERNYDRVIEEATKSLAKYPDSADLYLKRGTAYGGQGKTAEALADFDKALGLASRNLDDFLTVVRQMATAVPADTAIVHLTERLKADDKSLGLRVGLAQVQMESGRFRESLQTLDPILSDKTSPVRPAVLRMAALARYQLGEFRAAVDLYQELLAIRRDDVESLNNAALILGEDLKQPKEGLALAERAMKILKSQRQEIAYVNNGNVLDTYGWLKFLSGDLTGAATDLNQAIASDPLPITYLHLGKVMAAQKRTSDARRYLELGQALAQKTKDPTLAMIQQTLRDLR